MRPRTRQSPQLGTLHTGTVTALGDDPTTVAVELDNLPGYTYPATVAVGIAAPVGAHVGAVFTADNTGDLVLIVRLP